MLLIPKIKLKKKKRGEERERDALSSACEEARRRRQERARRAERPQKAAQAPTGAKAAIALTGTLTCARTRTRGASRGIRRARKAPSTQRQVQTSRRRVETESRTTSSHALSKPTKLYTRHLGSRRTRGQQASEFSLHVISPPSASSLTVQAPLPTQQHAIQPDTLQDAWSLLGSSNPTSCTQKAIHTTKRSQNPSI